MVQGFCKYCGLPMDKHISKEPYTEPICPPLVDLGESKIGDGGSYGWTRKTGAVSMPTDSPELVEWAKKLTTTLQLLVIDLGDSVVVKVEKGDAARLFKDIIVTSQHENTAIISVPFSGFESVKASIDALDSEKPVPRIEEEPGGAWQLHFDNQGIEPQNTYIGPNARAALESLFEKPLPVYEAKKGEWVQMYPVTLPEVIPVKAKETTLLSDVADAIRGIIETTNQSMPLSVWRYTK